MARQIDLSAVVAQEVIDGLKTCYRKTVVPLEKDYRFDFFYDAPLMDADFDAKPMVLIMGQYSVGKTTFIRHLIGRDFPGMRIGPEPTTDKFTCVYYSKEDAAVPGAVLTMNQDLPFTRLGKFGQHFLNKFEGSACSSNALKSLTFVDTPGVLSGEKQTRRRQYDYNQVTDWFANKASRILLLFDCNKLDVSDEFKQLIKSLRGYDDKIRIILNKSDTMPERDLIRVYGALMWNLGKVFKTPEVVKVYISSFGDKPLDKKNYCYPLFKEEALDLIGELKSLPRNRAMHSINKMMKRMRLVKLHCDIILELKAELPVWWGKKAKQRQIIEELPKRFKRIAKKLGVEPGDFPSLEKFQRVLEDEDLSQYPKPSARKFKLLSYAMNRTIPALFKKLNLAANKEFVDDEDGLDDTINPFTPESDSEGGRSKTPSVKNMASVTRSALVGRRVRANSPSVKVKARSKNNTPSVQEGSVRSSSRPRGRSTVPSYLGKEDAESMLIQDENEPKRALPRRTSQSTNEWVVKMRDKTESDNIFYKYATGGRLRGRAARKAFHPLGLPSSVMMKVWELVDFEDKHEIDADQFALAYWLGKRVIEGEKLPTEITWEMVPPSYRDL